MRHGAVLAFPLVASLGCAHGAGGKQAHGDVVCLQEPQTGSHIVETRCYTRAEIEERRKADHDMLERAQINSSRPIRRRSEQ